LLIVVICCSLVVIVCNDSVREGEVGTHGLVDACAETAESGFIGVGDVEVPIDLIPVDATEDVNGSVLFRFRVQVPGIADITSFPILDNLVAFR